MKWNRISRKQSARWQHLSQLKARALSFLQKNVSFMKHNNLYLGLTTPSSDDGPLLYTKANEVTSLIKRGSWIENSSLH
jgi:hypothetical protein